MAYRHALALGCVTFGIVALGCGGGNAASQAPEDGDALPTRSGDQPPANPDQPPAAKADQPAPSSDQPPGSPSSGGGGNSEAEALCRQFCQGVTSGDCPGSGANAQARGICEDGCVVTPDIEPCLTEAVGLINCLAELDGLCTADGLSDADNTRCNSAAGALNDCVNGDDTGNPPAGGTCATGTDCEKCVCKAGTDVNKILACADSCGNP